MNTNLALRRLTLFAAILAFVVVTLGAYTRLTDAGLGCPDWPGCYNHMIVPESQNAISQAEHVYPGWPVETIKAWTEMIHRYAAGTLGILILILAGIAIRKRKQPGQPLIVPLLLVAIAAFQAALGMWTVTLRLTPIVVMGHLLGGMTILALLWWTHLKSKALNNAFSNNSDSFQRIRPWAIAGLVIVACQIALGGWTSANYAALVCPNFPYCTAHVFFPKVDFHDAFNVFSALSAHAAVGHLSQAALMTIQMTHRLGAFITAFYLGLLGIFLLAMNAKPLKLIGSIILLLLATQITLGVLNIVMMLPLPVALLHNSVAALLLLTLVTLIYFLFNRRIDA